METYIDQNVPVFFLFKIIFEGLPSPKGNQVNIPGPGIMLERISTAAGFF